MGYRNVMKEIGTATIGLPVLAVAIERVISVGTSPPRPLPEAVLAAGIPVALLGVALVIWSGYLLWKVGGISLQLPLVWKGYTSNPRRLVTSGPYRFVRNPFVMGDILFLVGLGIALNSLPLLVLVIPWWMFSHYKITRYEEENLLLRFGEEYVAYRDRVAMWFPVKLGHRQAKMPTAAQSPN